MNERLIRRKLKFYLRLNYPLQVVISASGANGVYPDLPGCTATESDLEKLRVRIERMRRDYLTRQVEAGKDPPMPNSHLRAPDEALS